MKAEQYTVEETVLAGWPVRLSSYRIGATWHCKADNVSPGATIATGKGASRVRAKLAALKGAEARLSRTRKRN